MKTKGAVSDRKKYGVAKSPIMATRAFVKPLDHFVDGGIDGKAWILINDENNTRISVNTYDGVAGKNFKAQSHAMPDDQQKVVRLLRGYKELPISECPVAIQA